MEGLPGYYRHPTIWDDQVVFVAEDDAWIVGAGGGIARRMTANPGSISFPCIAPGGDRVAFVSRDEGHPEAFVVDLGGGPLERLTHFGGLTSVAAWSGDGADVIVATDWEQPFASLTELVAVPANGGIPRRLGFGPARAVSFDPRGRGVVIGRNSADPARWKRYRGGTAGTLWIDRNGDGDFEELIELDGNLARPMWIGRRIYFLSDHEGYGNLYSCTPTGRSLTRHTHHEDFYARHPHTDGTSVVYHSGADIWRYDIATDSTTRLDIRLHSPQPQRNRRFEPASKYIESIELHPKGEAVAVTARGTVFTAGLWEGAPVAHDRNPDSRLRLAAWLPDGERFVAVSDVSGEERLVVLTADGAGEPRTLGADVGRPFWLEPAPAGPDRIAVLNQRQELLLVNVRSGQAKVLHRSPYDRIHGMAWSPDGRWIAFGAATSRRGAALHLADTTTGRQYQITSGDFQDGWPSFDPGGTYLYFLSWRTYNPVSDALFFDHGFPAAARPYLIPLSAGAPSPFAPEQRESRPPGAPPAAGDTAKNGNAKNGNAKNGNGGRTDAPPAPVEIDLEGIQDRIVALPIAEGRYTKVAGATGRILVSSVPVEGALPVMPNDLARPKGKLQAYDFARERVETVMEGISGFGVSADGKVIGIRSGPKLRVVAASFKEDSPGPEDKNRETGWIDLDRLRLEINPGREWRQMLREAWRLQRDQFWTEDMSGIDWVSVYERYAPLVDRVAARSEFSDLMWEMQGELGTSHAYELGGDYRPEPTWYRGFLGADLAYDRRAGAWRVRDVVRGDTWISTASSPLAAPGIDVHPGDRLLSIDGIRLSATVTPAKTLADQAGRAVRVELARGRRRPRTVTIRTLKNERPLRYRAWVEANRRHVHEATGGAVGYVHVPDMGATGFAEFHRYYPVEAERIGLLIDVRFNGGGNVSQLLLEKLVRKRIGYDQTRYGGTVPYPADSPLGPMAALTNEWAGSDGDIFSHAFKSYGLGPLIGTRTWGGVIGIWPRHSLVDGTITTQPEFSYWFTDVGWEVENYGTDPDIEVVITPQDYREGRDPQLERGISEVLRIIEERGARQPEFGPRPDLRPPRLP